MDGSGSSTLNSSTKRQKYKAVDETEVDDQVLEYDEGEDSCEDIYGDIDWEEGDVSKLASTTSAHNNNVNGINSSQLVINPDHVSCYIFNVNIT